MMRLSLGFESSGSAIAVIGGMEVQYSKGRIEFERDDYSMVWGGASGWRGTSLLITCLMVCLFTFFFHLLLSQLSVHPVVGGLSESTSSIHVYMDTQYMDPMDWAPLPLPSTLRVRGRCSLFCVLRQFTSD